MKKSIYIPCVSLAVCLYLSLSHSLQAGPNEDFILRSQKILEGRDVPFSDKSTVLLELERLKTDAAIALLKKELLTVLSPVSKEMSITGDYPCAKALIRIGNRSIEPMVDTVLNTVIVHERVLAAYVLLEIVGVEKARSLLNAKQIRLNSPIDVARLKEALVALESNTAASLMIAKSEGRPSF